MTLGGRAAEELVFDEVTTGAANDLEKVTGTAKNMIMRYGMSEKLGPRTLGHRQDQPFLGRDMGHDADYSQEIAREIDDEIRRIIEDAHERARQVLAEHMDELHRISKILLERETIDRAAVPAPARRRERGRRLAGRRGAGRAGRGAPRQESKPRGLGLPLPSPRPPETPPAQA